MPCCITSSENPIFLQNVLPRGKKKKKGKHRRSEVLAEGSFYSWKRSERSGNADSHLHKWGFRVPEVTRKEQEEGLRTNTATKELLVAPSIHLLSG